MTRLTLEGPEHLRALVTGLRHAHDKVMSQKRLQSMYGGREQIARFNTVLKQLERMVKKLPVSEPRWPEA